MISTKRRMSDDPFYPPPGGHLFSYDNLVRLIWRPGDAVSEPFRIHFKRGRTGRPVGWKLRINPAVASMPKYEVIDHEEWLRRGKPNGAPFTAGYPGLERIAKDLSDGGRESQWSWTSEDRLKDGDEKWAYVVRVDGGPSDAGRRLAAKYPHRCRCGSPAYVGFMTIDCARAGCPGFAP